jgi:type I restriction enzyme S subunit
MEATLDRNEVRQWKRYGDLQKINHRWIDEMPSHWSKKRISYLFDLLGSGTTPNTSERKFYDEGNIPWVNTGDLNDDIVTDTEKCVNETAIKEYSALKIYPAGTLLIALYGATIGKLGLLSAPSTVNQACFAMGAPRIDVAPRYVLYWLLGNREHIVSMAYGGGQPNISGELIRSLRITVPPIAEQRAISAFLDRETVRIDALIARKQRLIDLLEEKRQAVISNAVTKGLDSRVVMKDSHVHWIGEIPSHWSVVPLKRSAFFQEGPGLRQWQFAPNGIRVICVTNITELGIDFSAYQKFISEEEYQTQYKHFTVKNGDLLLSSSGNSWGKVAEFMSEEPVILNTSTIRINENGEGTYNRKLLKWALQATFVREQLDQMMTGSCQPNFGPTHLSKVVIPLPPTQEQQVIARYLEERTKGFAEVKAKILGSITQLHEYRTALISAAVTGQIDVREVVELDG